MLLKIQVEKVVTRSKKLTLLLLALLLFATAFSQQHQKKITSIELRDIESAYVDRPGDIYIYQKNNTLKKFDTLGNLVLEKIFDQNPTMFDPRDGARMFTFFVKGGKCSYFSEETKQEFLIEQQYAIEPIMACSSGDHNIWLFDQADFSIKRVNPSLSKVMAESIIDQKQFSHQAEVIFMREYQNFLFLLDKNSGILIFNSLGIQIKKIPVAEISYFNFLGEELYYKKNDKLIFHDLFDSSIREELVDPSCLFALLTDSRKFLVYQNRLDIFENH